MLLPIRARLPFDLSRRTASPLAFDRAQKNRPIDLLGPPNNSLQLTRLACGKLELVLPAELP
jgi:hypothetical protein